MMKPTMQAYLTDPHDRTQYFISHGGTKQNNTSGELQGLQTWGGSQKTELGEDQSAPTGSKAWNQPPKDRIGALGKPYESTPKDDSPEDSATDAGMSQQDTAQSTHPVDANANCRGESL